MRAILITGTDTGVGKTFITYNLARSLKERGVKVGCFKPVETYVMNVPEDGRLLATATGQEIEEVVPFTYRLPLSPRAGEIEEGKEVSLRELEGHFRRLTNKYELLLVEGAGGIAVPIKERYTYGDLARDWRLEVVIVGRAGLGTINHTYLSWFYTKALGLKLRGIVLNRFTGEDISERTNPQIIYEMTGMKPLCIRESNSLELPERDRVALLELVGL